MQIIPADLSPEGAAALRITLIVLATVCTWYTVRYLYQCLVTSVANTVVIAKVALLSPQAGDTLLVTSSEYLTTNTRNAILAQFAKVVGDDAKVMLLAPGLEVSMVRAAGITSNL